MHAKKVITVADYLKQLPADRAEQFNKLRVTILENLPPGFTEEISYGMIGYVVPFSLYPEGYHCNPQLPLPFVSIASQKNHIAFYHMGIYADKQLQQWFVAACAKQGFEKLDMGKSCIRFKKTDQIPYGIIGELIKKVSVKDWINKYETTLKK